jgi:hypothetical protein
MFKRKPTSNKKLQMALQIAIEALEHYAIDGSVGRHTSGHGESSEHISFYHGLKIKPSEALKKMAEVVSDGRN